jgi:hypothetical protein
MYDPRMPRLNVVCQRPSAPTPEGATLEGLPGGVPSRLQRICLVEGQFSAIIRSCRLVPFSRLCVSGSCRLRCPCFCGRRHCLCCCRCGHTAAALLPLLLYLSLLPLSVLLLPWLSLLLLLPLMLLLPGPPPPPPPLLLLLMPVLLLPMILRHIAPAAAAACAAATAAATTAKVNFYETDSRPAWIIPSTPPKLL